MEIETIIENEKVTRTATLGGREYDFTNHPGMFFVTAMLLWAVVVVFVLAIVLALSAFASAAAPYLPYIVGGILLWVACGGVKYWATGTGKPFFNIKITTASSSEVKDDADSL